jgi:hypothetical protein
MTDLARPRAVLRDPLLHFLALGLALFAIYAWRADPRPSQAADERSIVVRDVDVDVLAGQFESTFRRPPTDQERAALIDDYIRREIMVREALALGLDEGDTVIRNRLVQKMDFLLASFGASEDPTEADLAAHLQANAERFERPARIAFEQVFLGEQPTEDEIAAALAALRSGADPQSVGQRSLLRPFMPLSPAAAVDGVLGRNVFEGLSAQPVGIWSGPIASGYGQHLVRIDAYEPAERPALDLIRGQVEADWRRLRSEERAAEQFQALRDRYRIDRPAGPAP